MVMENFLYEIVPILDIKKADQALNITDVSPLHAAYVNKHGKSLKDDIRLLKQFCRAQKVYGAESFIQGFSGYICELLVIAYGGFLPLMKAAAKWKDKVVLDVAGHWKGKDVLMELNKSKLISPLVIVDPVQKDRNAGAAVSVEKFEAFKAACKVFLRKPSKELFEVNVLSMEEIKKANAKEHVIEVKIKPHSGKRDVVGCQLIKGLEHIQAQLQRHEFTLLDSGLEFGKDVFYFLVLKNEKLSKTVEREGPPLDRKEHVEQFKKKHKKSVVRKGRVIGVDVRKYMEPDALLNELKKDKYMKEKMKGFSVKCL